MPPRLKSPPASHRANAVYLPALSSFLDFDTELPSLHISLEAIFTGKYRKFSMPEITSESYPQKIDSRSMLTERVLTGPGAFKWGENIVFWRVSRLLSLAPSENTLRLLCETKPFLNRTCWTHETSMHQFAEDKENQPSTLNVEIAFWSKHVFRVQFSRDPIPTTPPFPPPEARMLIGEPEASFELAVAEIEGGWVARRGSCLHVDQTPVSATMYDRVFWQRVSRFVYRRYFDMIASAMKWRRPEASLWTVKGNIRPWRTV
jgi:hypothetical protein